MYLRQQINSLVFEGAVIDCFSIKLKILVAEICPFFTKAQKMSRPRFQVVELSRFCAQRPLLRIAASREQYVDVRIFLQVIFVLSVHAAIHCHLIFLSKPAAKFGRKLEPLLLVQLHGNGHIHFAGQGGVFAFFSVLCQQPQVLSADGGATFRHKNLSRHHPLLAPKIEHTAIGSRQARRSPVGSGGYRASAVCTADGLHVKMINRHSYPRQSLCISHWGVVGRSPRARKPRSVFA